MIKWTPLKENLYNQFNWKLELNVNSNGPLNSVLKYYQLPSLFFNSLIWITIPKYEWENLKRSSNKIITSKTRKGSLRGVKYTNPFVTYRFNEVHLVIVCLYSSPPIVIWIPVPYIKKLKEKVTQTFFQVSRKDENDFLWLEVICQVEYGWKIVIFFNGL